MANADVCALMRARIFRSSKGREVVMADIDRTQAVIGVTSDHYSREQNERSRRNERNAFGE